MAVMSYEEVNSIIINTKEELENERVLCEGLIIEAVESQAKIKGVPLSELKPAAYAQQWMLLNIPQIQDSKASMQLHHEEVMVDKFTYYNRTNNYDGLLIWVGSLLKNIGFTDYQADIFLEAVTKLGEKLYNRARMS